MARPTVEIDDSTLRGQFGKNLRRLRMAVFEYQGEFADALGEHNVIVDKRTISNWEHGVRMPAVELLPYLAAALGCDVRHLVPSSFKTPPKLFSPIVIDTPKSARKKSSTKRKASRKRKSSRKR